MGYKAFPYRIMAWICDHQYQRLRDESRAHGYQVAVVLRWLLLPQASSCLYPGSLDGADGMMRRPFPSGTVGGELRPAGTRHGIRLSDAEYEVITRAAMMRGVTRATYVSEILAEQFDLAERLGWPLPEDITNVSVDADARQMLHELEEDASVHR
ncbi:hypothetical protein LMG10733_1353 [Bifidobacterium adolescentis]|nr:hypothetical protein [Bifidobacterium adolescentis]MCT6790189.1 hypothetical protein [Bifidobacterium adolescentis]NRD15904.1 hypothetical protein [Bifidobacterium adolescentis]OSG97465.1 hypothetical protein LMG10733_1353 [Bifidobacterium adolescentis]SPU23405.1 Uncharacterised protein [Bifidobacterium adolescentis]